MLAVFCALGHGKPLPTERGRGVGRRAGRSRQGIVTAGAAYRRARRLLRDKLPPQNATRCRAGTRDRRQQYGVRLRNPAPRPSTHKARRPARAERRQDPRAVHDLRGPRSEKGPFVARSSRHASPNARLRGFSDARRACLAEAGSFRMHGGDMLPGRGAFPVRGPFGNA